MLNPSNPKDIWHRKDVQHTRLELGWVTTWEYRVKLAFLKFVRNLKRFLFQNTLLMLLLVSMCLWCSDYHVRLTCGRSPVQPWVKKNVFSVNFWFYLLFIAFNKPSIHQWCSWTDRALAQHVRCTRIDALLLQFSIFQTPFSYEKSFSTGNWTLVSRITGGNRYHYTIV